MDFGFVGEPKAIDPKIIEDLIYADEDYIPVIAPIGVAEDGQTYNINADTVAGALAGALGAKRMLMLTDVAGVLDGKGELVRQMTVAEARTAIADGAATGMIPKLETCIAAVEAGVGAVVILDGRRPHAMLVELFTEHGAGTLVQRMKADLRLDLRHVDTWLFDLDNTLYPAESGFMRGLESRMTDYVERVTGLPRDEAYKLQKRYLSEYGLTLGGLVAHHGVDPHDYHAMFDDLPLDVLAEDPALVAAIAALPGRRLIFTNANDVHAGRVLERLGLAHLFHDIFHIALSDYVPKPSLVAFERMDAALSIDPASTAFFEDSERNLAPSRRTSA